MGSLRDPPHSRVVIGICSNQLVPDLPPWSPLCEVDRLLRGVSILLWGVSRLLSAWEVSILLSVSSWPWVNSLFWRVNRLLSVGTPQTGVYCPFRTDYWPMMILIAVYWPQCGVDRLLRAVNRLLWGVYKLLWLIGILLWWVCRLLSVGSIDCSEGSVNCSEWSTRQQTALRVSILLWWVNRLLWGVDRLFWVVDRLLWGVSRLLWGVYKLLWLIGILLWAANWLLSGVSKLLSEGSIDCSVLSLSEWSIGE